MARCIDPFSETDGEFATGIVNIATGNVVPGSKTNIYECSDILVKTAQAQLDFKASLPDGFNEKIQSNAE